MAQSSYLNKLQRTGNSKPNEGEQPRRILKMAARLRKNHQDEVRTKIQTSQLINKLQNHALSDGDEEISNSRMKAIEILLKKSLPDLTAIQMSGDEDNPVRVVTKIELVALDANSTNTPTT